jgi:hypothetical protein
MHAVGVRLDSSMQGQLSRSVVPRLPDYCQYAGRSANLAAESIVYIIMECCSEKKSPKVDDVDDNEIYTCQQWSEN